LALAEFRDRANFNSFSTSWLCLFDHQKISLLPSRESAKNSGSDRFWGGGVGRWHPNANVSTQNFHLPRAVYIGRAMGIQANGLGTRDWGRYGIDSMSYHTLREIVATAKALWQVHLTRPRPIGLNQGEKTLEQWDCPVLVPSHEAVNSHYQSDQSLPRGDP